jgi:predicted dienelactone hydrolase
MALEYCGVLAQDVRDGQRHRVADEVVRGVAREDAGEHLPAQDAPAEAGRFPLIVVSHGYGNVPVGMSWLTENLASKGYVVAAIRHEDRYLEPAAFPQAALRRPLDIAFVARELQRRMGVAGGTVDATRTALIGYSMGGYGVLAAGGATLDPGGALVSGVPGGLMTPYARGGRLSSSLVAPAVKAIVALAPGGSAFGAFGPEGMAAIKAPLLLIAGDHDLTVDYTTGARAYFDQAIHSDRYLLTFLHGGHALGLGPVPTEMRDDLWNHDWFEDPVWRKERLMAISLHFVTAFLDRHVKDDASRSAYIDGLVVESGKGTWDAPAGTPWAARSPGGEITLWKGFQRRHATGLTWMHETAVPAQ